MQTHQNNYLRIQQLTAATTTLDNQIRETLRTLASTRKDITTTSTTTFPDGPHYDIKYDELLSYARRISKTTLPPSGVINGIDTPGVTSPAAGDGAETAAPTPAASTPAMNGAQTPGAMGGEPTSEIPSQMTVTTQATSLPEHLAGWLNPLTGTMFIPWPAEDKIRAGSLASNQLLMEQGLDIRNYDPAEEQARRQREEEERKAHEEREIREREESLRKMREEQEQLRREREQARAREQQEDLRRGSIAGVGPQAGGAPRPPQEKKQFQFMGDLDDDDE